jgi:hypothetical protein
MLIGHFIVIQTDMVSKLMDYGVMNFLYDLVSAPTPPKNRPPIDGNPRRLRPAGREEGLLRQCLAFVQAQQFVSIVQV